MRSRPRARHSRTKTLTAFDSGTMFEVLVDQSLTRVLDAMIGTKVTQILCPIAGLYLELVNPGNSACHSGLPGLSTPNDFMFQSRITTNSTTYRICASYLLHPDQVR